MNTVDFIEADIQCGARSPRWVHSLSSALIFLIPIGLGIFLRENIDGVFDPMTFFPNLAALGLTYYLTQLLLQRRPSSHPVHWVLGICLIAFGFSSNRLFFPEGFRTIYSSPSRFWHENLKCISKGILTSGLCGTLLLLVSFRYSPLPTRLKRLLLCAVSGLAGITMLGFHCDSSHLGHVLVAHTGSGMLAGAALLLVQQLLIRRKLGRAFPGLSTRLPGFNKLS